MRRSRRYSPFYRSPGLRRLPDDGIALAFICSLLLHAAFVVWVVRATEAPPWSMGADMSLVSLADLVTADPVSQQAAAVDQDKVARAIRDQTTPPRTPRPSLPPAPTLRAGVPTSPASVHAHSVSAVERVRTAPSLSTPPASPPAPSPTAELPAAASLEPASTVRAGPVALLSPAEVDGPLDPGAPEPPPSAPVAPPAAAAAQALTPAQMIAGGSAVAETLSNPAVTPQPAFEEAVPAPQPARAVPPLEIAGPPTVAGPPVEPIAAPPPGLPAMEAVEKARPASPLGLGLGRVRVQLDGPRERVTDRPTATISGKLLGGPTDRLVLFVNGVPTTVSHTDRTFEVSVPLQPGSNYLRAVATGAGLEAEDLVTVEYVTPPASSNIVLTTPVDGLAIGPDDPPVIVVEGQVDDKTIDTAWIVANDRRVPVAIRDGRFRQVMLVAEPLLRLWVETSANGRPAQRSQTVTVHNAENATPTGVLVVQWPSGVESSNVEVSATWRAQADRLDAPEQTVRLPALARPGDGTPSEVFYLRGVKPGVYTVAIRSRGAAPSGDVRSTFYLPDRTGFSARPLRPARLKNGGRTVLAKVLLPYGVLWSQDDWFSGMSESVDTVTKFRVPEGISWIERKADLP